jgi:uncharacterized Zn finger protein (UPF0148 family)
MVGELANCKRCGVLFVKKHSNFCPQCAHELDELLIKIRAYLELFPDAKIEDIQTALNISLKDIVALKQEGRIELK